MSCRRTPQFLHVGMGAPKFMTTDTALLAFTCPLQPGNLLLPVSWRAVVQGGNQRPLHPGAAAVTRDDHIQIARLCYVATGTFRDWGYRMEGLDTSMLPWRTRMIHAWVVVEHLCGSPLLLSRCFMP